MIILSSGARALLEVISVRVINWISQYTSRSNGNIYRGIQLIIDVIDYKMLKGKYLVSTFSAHPMRLHN